MKKVLIVDDFIEYRYEYMAMLEELYNIYLAEDLEQAKEKLNDSFHLAVIDINLDRFDRNNKGGIQLGRWIRKFFPGIKILFVSAFFPEDEVENIYDVYMQKPIIEDILREEVKKLIGK